MKKHALVGLFAILSVLLCLLVAVGCTADPTPAETTEATEEPIEISLPTEDPNDVMPEETFSEEDEVPPVTVDPDATEGTEDRESNETPEDVFETGD